MGEVGSSEIQRPETQTEDRLRAVQRQKILHDHIKNSSVRELFGALVPSDRIRSNTAVDESLLKQLAETLKKDTHTVLFGLAATAKNPMELYNILFNIASLKKVKSSYWKFEDSEDHFLKRKLPEYVDVSEEAKDQAEAMSSDSQHLLESFFYTISTENVSIGDKRLALGDLYAVKTFLPPTSGNEESLKIYGPESSFWSHVDGSWIYPKLSPVSAEAEKKAWEEANTKEAAKLKAKTEEEKIKETELKARIKAELETKKEEDAKKPNVVGSIGSDIKGRLKHPEATPEPNEPSAQSEDLSKLTIDELTDRFYQSGKRALDLNNTIDKMRAKDPMGDFSEFRSRPEVLRIDREIKDIDDKTYAILRQMERRLTPNEFREISSRIRDRVFEEAKVQETDQPPTPTPRPPAPESTAPTTAERSSSSRVRRPAFHPRFDRFLREADQPDKESVIELGTGNKDLVQELNEKLKEQATDNVTFAVSPDLLKEYLTSMAQGAAKGGSIEVLPNNAILLKGVQLETKVGKATVKANVDIAMHNNENEDGIEATLLEYRSGNVATKLGGALRAFGGPSVRGEIEKELANINATVKTKLNEQIDPGLSSWTAERISISGDKVRVMFNKLDKGPDEDELDVPSFLRRRTTSSRRSGFFR